MTFELGPAGAQVKLTVTHDGFEPASEMLNGISGGWPQIPASHKSLLETPPPHARARPAIRMSCRPPARRGPA